MADSAHDRDYGIDVMRGILVVGMILGHVIGLLTEGHQASLNLAGYLINLVSYSGFLFCFGFATQIAYFSRPRAARLILITAGRLLLAFYISALAYQLFVAHDRLDLASLLGIVPRRLSPSAHSR